MKQREDGGKVIKYSSFDFGGRTFRIEMIESAFLDYSVEVWEEVNANSGRLLSDETLEHAVDYMSADTALGYYETVLNDPAAYL